MSFADRLRTARREKGYSQEELAEVLEVSRQSITKWETKAAYPELKKLLLLSVKLDKDLNWLFLDERNELTIGKENSRDSLEAGSAWIYDVKSLRKECFEQQIHKVLDALEGLQLNEHVDNEAFIGDITYVFLKSDIYVVSNGTDQRRGADCETVTKLDTKGILDLLIRHMQEMKSLYD